ncbi:caspase-14 [Dipodomys spectabilis]|uniref:caspase-14 n=1 Tax=Dipodomys spectabilis TaxID=105255 RepID=UPI001C5466DA|nr:caspase-14 [Dipodomys spectabilis]
MEAEIQPQPLEEETYDMSGARLALTLCVTEEREGSEADLDALERMFRQLRFENTTKENPTGQQFLEEMRTFQETLDGWAEPVSCAFVVLMAHGDEGLLKGVDEEMVELDSLFAALNNKNCAALRGKPKLFMVQACRGEHRDLGEAIGGDQVAVMEQEHPQTIPTFTDTVHVYATMEGHIAYRHDKDGSSFIQTVADVFTKKKGPVLELLTEVTRRMAEAELVQEGRVRKVNPEIMSTLRKRLYLQ